MCRREDVNRNVDIGKSEQYFGKGIVQQDWRKLGQDKKSDPSTVIPTVFQGVGIIPGNGKIGLIGNRNTKTAIPEQEKESDACDL